MPKSLRGNTSLRRKEAYTTQIRQGNLAETLRVQPAYWW